MMMYALRSLNNNYPQKFFYPIFSLALCAVWVALNCPHTAEFLLFLSALNNTEYIQKYNQEFEREIVKSIFLNAKYLVEL